MHRLLTRSGKLMRSVERRGILSLAEVPVGQIEFHVIGIGIRTQCTLKMLDRIVE